jgi:hypothetical protein
MATRILPTYHEMSLFSGRRILHFASFFGRVHTQRCPILIADCRLQIAVADCRAPIAKSKEYRVQSTEQRVQSTEQIAIQTIL